MAIAKQLEELHADSMQDCPLCGRANRIVMKGVFVQDKKIELQPDSGYSFCNCKAVFYTNAENLHDEVRPEPNADGLITYPDPFFAWPNPYDFLHWNIRKYRILFDMDSLCDELVAQGYEIVSARRDFDVHSETPQHFHIRIRCQESA